MGSKGVITSQARKVHVHVPGYEMTAMVVGSMSSANQNTRRETNWEQWM